MQSTVAAPKFRHGLLGCCSYPSTMCYMMCCPYCFFADLSLTYPADDFPAIESRWCITFWAMAIVQPCMPMIMLYNLFKAFPAIQKANGDTKPAVGIMDVIKLCICPSLCIVQLANQLNFNNEVELTLYPGSKELLTQVGLNTGCAHFCCPSHWQFAKLLADAANERENVGGVNL